MAHWLRQVLLANPDSPHPYWYNGLYRDVQYELQGINGWSDSITPKGLQSYEIQHMRDINRGKNSQIQKFNQQLQEWRQQAEEQTDIANKALNPQTLVQDLAAKLNNIAYDKELSKNVIDMDKIGSYIRNILESLELYQNYASAIGKEISPEEFARLNQTVTKMAVTLSQNKGIANVSALRGEIFEQATTLLLNSSYGKEYQALQLGGVLGGNAGGKGRDNWKQILIDEILYSTEWEKNFKDALTNKGHLISLVAAQIRKPDGMDVKSEENKIRNQKNKANRESLNEAFNSRYKNGAVKNLNVIQLSDDATPAELYEIITTVLRTGYWQGAKVTLKIDNTLLEHLNSAIKLQAKVGQRQNLLNNSKRDQVEIKDALFAAFPDFEQLIDFYSVYSAEYKLQEPPSLTENQLSGLTINLVPHLEETPVGKNDFFVTAHGILDLPDYMEQTGTYLQLGYRQQSGSPKLLDVIHSNKQMGGLGLQRKLLP